MQDKAQSRNKQSISTLEKPLIIDKPFVQLNSDVRLLLLMWHVFYHVLAGLSILWFDISRECPRKSYFVEKIQLDHANIKTTYLLIKLFLQAL